MNRQVLIIGLKMFFYCVKKYSRLGIDKTVFGLLYHNWSALGSGPSGLGL